MKTNSIFPIIYPCNKFKLFWDFMMIILTFCHFLFLIPLITFPNNSFDSFYYKWLIVLSITSLIDVFMKLHSGFFENGNSIVCQEKILLRYLKKELAFDILAFLLMFSYLEGNKSILFQLMYFLKYPAFMNQCKNIEKMLFLEGKIKVYIDLLKILANFFLFAHYAACIWIFLGSTSSIKGQTWLTSYNSSEEKSIGFCYIISIYWAVSTISRTGVGDITPKNEYEFCFCSAVMLLSLIFFGYSLSCLFNIYSKTSKEEQIKRFLVFFCFFVKIFKFFIF